jgi:hypothetical protein
MILLVNNDFLFADYVLSFTSEPINIIKAEGKNATISCKASSTDGPVTYTWLLNGSTLVSDSIKYHFDGHSNLTIINLQRHIDNGVYRCIATNKAGSILSNQALLQVACK